MLCKVRILSHYTACHLTIHHPMQCMCPARTPTTLLPFSLKANNPSWGMHPLLNLWERPMKSPGTMHWASSSLTLHMSLRDQHLVACLSPIPWGLSYPNFVRGQLFDGMQPLFDRFEVLGTLCCIIREVSRHVGNQKEALLRNPRNSVTCQKSKGSVVTQSVSFRNILKAKKGVIT